MDRYIPNKNILGSWYIPRLDFLNDSFNNTGKISVLGTGAVHNKYIFRQMQMF